MYENLSYLTLMVDTKSSPTIQTNASYSSKNATTFIITKASIKESLENPFIIECEGFIESAQRDILGLDPSNTNTINSLIDRTAILNISNPYEATNKILHFNDQATASNKNSNNQTKHYKGIITHIQYKGAQSQNNKTLNLRHNFHLTIQSPLIRMSLNIANRIYTDITPLQAIKNTFRFYSAILEKNLDFSKILQDYETQELISQYNESDLDFMMRMANNNGIYFYEDSDTIYFCDNLTKNTTKHVIYNPNIQNNTLNNECIYAINKEKSIMTNSFTNSSNNVNTPIYPLSCTLNTKDTQSKETQILYNKHGYVGNHSFTQKINLKTPTTLQEKRIEMLNETLQAKSNIYHLSLADFIKIDCDIYGLHNTNKQDFIITALDQILIDNFNANTNQIHSDDTKQIKNDKDLHNNNIKTTTKSYTNILTIIPSHITYIPTYKPKPKAPLHTQGIVIGESYIKANNQAEANKSILQEANMIHTDNYGRVRVRFNIYANQEELDNMLIDATQNISPSYNGNGTQQKCSYTTFLRIISPIASNNSGFFAIPRISDEVIISFLDGDIDKPFISGSLYNQHATIPQYSYPRYKRDIADDNLSILNLFPSTLYNGLEEQKQENNENLNATNNNYMTFSNATIGTDNNRAEARNEITLKNDKDQEEFYILAQKDYKEEIGNNYEQTIQKNKISEVGALHTEFITLGHIQNIKGFKNINVGLNYLENISLSKDTNIGLSNTLNVGVNNEVNVSQNYDEYVGIDKKIVINNNLEQDVKNDCIQRIGHNKNETIQGSYVIQSNNSIKTLSKYNTSIESSQCFRAEADDSISFKGKKDCSFASDFINVLANKEIASVAQKKIASQVGDAIISQTKDKVVIQVGGVQIIIDNKGLRVKGGDLRID